MRFLIASLALLSASIALTADAAPFANTAHTIKLHKQDLPDNFTWKQRWNINMHRVLNRMEGNIRAHVLSGDIPAPLLGSVERYLNHGASDIVDVNEYGDIFDADKDYGTLNDGSSFGSGNFGKNVDNGKIPCDNKGKSNGEGSSADESGSSGEPIPPPAGHNGDKPEEPKAEQPKAGTDEPPQTNNPEQPKAGTDEPPQTNNPEQSKEGTDEQPQTSNPEQPKEGADEQPQTSNPEQPKEGTDEQPQTSNPEQPKEGTDEQPQTSNPEQPKDGNGPEGGNTENGKTAGLEGQDNDLGYFGELEISGQKFNVIFDTGSTDLWVPHPECPDAACKSHTSFDFAKSKTFKPSEQNFHITFGSGSVAGDVAEDDVSVAGIFAKGQKFGLARTMSVQFNGAPFDGIMGMALDKKSRMGATMTFNTMVNQGSVKEPVFSFALGREKDNSESQLTLGGIDATKFRGELRFNKVVSDDGFWKIAMDTALVNGHPVGIQTRRATIDTGTTLLIATPQDARLIHSAIDGAIEEKGRFFVPCDTKAVVALQFGGVLYNIDPRDLAREPINRDNLCVSGISGVVIGGRDEWLVGDVFLKNVYSAYNVRNLEVGFAQLA